MDSNRVDMFMMANQKYFPAEKTVYVREKLLSLDENKFNLLGTISYKDPTTMLIVSLFLGSLGIDRFMIGDTGMGVLKLLTVGLCGILTIYDWVTIMNKCREKNFNDLMTKI